MSALINLPSAYYRVTIKAIIRDKHGRLLIGKTDDNTWEVPGGGWEHGETFEECIRREVKEELDVEVSKIGPILFTWIASPHDDKPIMLRIATKVELTDTNFKPADLTDAKFVDKEELLSLPFVPNEGGIKDNVDKLWPAT